MNPILITIEEKKVIGIKSTTHHNEYHNIVKLWKQFMPSKKAINNNINEELIAMQVYDDFSNFEKPFDIWACVEVQNTNDIPISMQAFTIPKGNYAIFTHKGMNAAATYQKIMTEWLPKSGYKINNRPHFQVMGDKYKQGSPDSEEQFYLPIKSLNK